MSQPLRVLFVTSTPPLDTLGGSLLFYRQFHQSNDYELCVITDNTAYQPNDRLSMVLRLPAFVQRLMRTRLGLFVHDAVHLLRGLWIPPDVWRTACRFQPDLVLTGCETSMADLASLLARRLRRPLVGHFMDWPTYGMLAHRPVLSWASRQFVHRYRRCQLAFGICPEMLSHLGPHPNARVFYPFAPEQNEPLPPPAPDPISPQRPYTLLFAGNLGEWYGQALLALHHAIPVGGCVKLLIAGRHANWSPSQEEALAAEGTYLGFLKGLAYRHALSRADSLLVIMGFDENARLIESTSFKSKIVDYLLAERPLIVWGPPYSTAVRHARAEGFGLVVDTPDASAVLAALERLSSDAALGQRLVEAGRRFRVRCLDADVVLPAALEAQRTLVADWNRSCLA
jgi:glycosyltransferase involved in cell wall biosynthesis